MAADAPSLAIVICTFKRPDLLRRALRSVAAQQAPATPARRSECLCRSTTATKATRGRSSREEASASPLADRLARGPSGQYFGGAQRRRRNAGDEDFVAFVDDDQELEPGWLDAVFRAVRDERADAWQGRVIGLFEAPERATPAIRNLFSRELAQASGLRAVRLRPAKARRPQPRHQ